MKYCFICGGVSPFPKRNVKIKYLTYSSRGESRRTVTSRIIEWEKRQRWNRGYVWVSNFSLLILYPRRDPTLYLQKNGATMNPIFLKHYDSMRSFSKTRQQHLSWSETIQFLIGIRIYVRYNLMLSFHPCLGLRRDKHNCLYLSVLYLT